VSIYLFNRFLMLSLLIVAIVMTGIRKTINNVGRMWH